MEALETPAQANFSPLLRRYTLEEFWALPEPEDHSRYNLIGGYLFMVPPPHPPHGDLAARMTKLLVKYMLDRQLEGDVHHPPEPIYRREQGSTYLEPDMMYVSKELRERMGEKRTSADIVFEYLSSSTSIYDRTTKADTYLALGVRELWLIDPVTVTIEVRHAKTKVGSLAWEILRYEKGSQAHSRVLEGWTVSVDGLFEGLA